MPWYAIISCVGRLEQCVEWKQFFLTFCEFNARVNFQGQHVDSSYNHLISESLSFPISIQPWSFIQRQNSPSVGTMQGSSLWWWCTHSPLTVFVLAAGTSTTSPCCETQYPATWVSGNMSREEPHGRRLSICAMDAHPPRTSCPPATAVTTGPVSPWKSSWTVSQTWPTTAKSACWLTWAWWAATTCPQWTRASATTSFWAAPWATWRTWLSTVWLSSSARRNTCLSGRSACASSPPSRRSTARGRPTWTWVRPCAGASRSSTSWMFSCTSMQRTCSSNGSSTPGRGSTKRCDWRGARRDAGWGSKGTRADHGRPNTKEAGREMETYLRRKLKTTCPPPLRTIQAKWHVGEASSNREMQQTLLYILTVSLFFTIVLSYAFICFVWYGSFVSFRKKMHSFCLWEPLVS